MKENCETCEYEMVDNLSSNEFCERCIIANYNKYKPKKQNNDYGNVCINCRFKNRPNNILDIGPFCYGINGLPIHIQYPTLQSCIFFKSC